MLSPQVPPSGCNRHCITNPTRINFHLVSVILPSRGNVISMMILYHLYFKMLLVIGLFMHWVTWIHWGTIQCNLKLPLSHRRHFCNALLAGSSASPPHSAVQSPAIQTRSPVVRRMKMTPCPSLPPPPPPATSRLPHSQRRLLIPAACVPAPLSGGWRKCHSLFPHYKVGRKNDIKRLIMIDVAPPVSLFSLLTYFLFSMDCWLFGGKLNINYLKKKIRVKNHLFIYYNCDQGI